MSTDDHINKEITFVHNIKIKTTSVQQQGRK